MATGVRLKGGALWVDSSDFEARAKELGLAAADMKPFLRSVIKGPAGEAIKRDVKGRVPIRTGALRASIDIHDSGSDVIIGPDQGSAPAAYAKFVESGAPPHIIRAKRGGWLSFGGILRKKVLHPGARKGLHMRKAIRSAKDDVMSALMRELDTYFDKHGAK